MTKGYQFAIGAGLLAALAAVVLKIALSFPGPIPDVVDRFLSTEYTKQVEWIIRVIVFLIGLLLNSIMMHFFIESMRHTSSLVATVVNGSVNFTTSSFLGWLFFNEALTSTWMFGTTCTLIGVYLINTADEAKKKHD